MAKKLNKTLGFWGVVAFAMGPMLSSGIFLLPGLIFEKVGPSAILAYIVAALLVVPALLSQSELATAMPKAGGTYYFLDRSMGPFIGTILGFGTWMSLAFKSAFDLIGLGAYLILFLDLPEKPVAVALCIVFAFLAISGTKNVGRFQQIFVSLVLGVMAFFVSRGFFEVHPMHFNPFFVNIKGDFVESIALVHVSFAGLTKIASVAEEVEDLDRNIPYGMMTALGITTLVYVLGLIIMIGVMPAQQLSGSLTPIVYAADQFMGRPGRILMTAAAIFAFVASANAGLTAASRYPLAMSRDNLLGSYWKKIGRFGTPTRSILLTMGLLIMFVLLLTTQGIAELGSAFLIIVFGMLNLSVIVMRESQITAYDPGFETKLYPWVQIAGIIAPIILIPELGSLSMMVSVGVMICGALWYFFYARKRVDRSAAMFHVFKRVGMQATSQLNEELKNIIREKGTRRSDVFEQVILRASVIWHQDDQDIESIYSEVTAIFADRLNLTDEATRKELDEGIHSGDTPIGDHVALAHAQISHADHPELAIIHSRSGIFFEGNTEPYYAIFVLVSPKDRPKQHLRFLAELANRAEMINFEEEWRDFSDEQEICKSFIRSEDQVESVIAGEKTAGKTISEINIDRDCIIAMIRRDSSLIVPHGDTLIEGNDELILVGLPSAIKKMKAYFSGEN
ncbi:MAG TPA: amino acid permease [Balneolaceae bacterium]|nr:amino acid permease [Balneolaceae bacterium]